MRISSRPPLARIMAIDQAVRAGAWPNGSTLAEQLEVDSRTIRRDITYMRDQLGAPLEYNPVRHGYCYIEPTFRLAYFQITEGELVSLLIAERLLRQYRGTPFEQDLRRAFAKLAEMLPEGVSVRLDAMADCLSVMPAVHTPYEPEVFAKLSTAVVCRRQVEMTYWTAGRNVTTSRVFDPYHLMLVDDGWYAVGMDHHRGKVLIFAAQRVRWLRETGATFDRPADFRVEDYMRDSFRAVRGEGHHRVAVRFSPEFAGRLAEKVWHHSQTNEATAEGGLIVRFEVSDLQEVERWVMFWGADCEVLEPPELRQRIYRQVEIMKRAYKRGAGHAGPNGGRRRKQT